MSNKMQIPKGFISYDTVEGKFASHIGPYFIKNNFPKTIFGVFVEEKQSNLNNVAHGGFLMAFADSVGGYFAYKTVKKSIVTVNLNSNFIRPAPVGCWLEAHGKVKKHGKRVVFVEIEIFIKKNIIFTSSGLWQIINIAKA